MKEPRLIIGIGNPGAKYRLTRHNAGWMVLDRLAAAWADGTWRKKHGGMLAEVRLPEEYARENAPAGTRLLLFKPGGYVNASGGPARRAKDYYRVPLERLLVVCDDVNLPLGYVRIRPRGSDGGHNGLKDVERHLGTREYNRLRIGVGAPAGERDLVGHVLGEFAAFELETLSAALDTAIECMLVWMGESMEAAMNRFNRRAPPQDDGERGKEKEEEEEK